MATPHNEAKIGDIAPFVLMPGDPLRAKFIAETFLTNIKQYNTVRNMYGFTGEYNGKTVSVQGSGMGMPSMAIYSYELYNVYGVETIIRIGSSGAISDTLELGDIVMSMGSCTDSAFANQYNLPGTFSPIADFGLLRKAVDVAEKLNIPYKVGNTVSTDTFYDVRENANDRWDAMGVLAVEMEAAALYMNAAKLGKKALAITTISDIVKKGLASTPEERQKTFTDMMKIALNIA